MELSKMFGVERDTDFEVEGYIGRFILRERFDGTERLWWRLKDNKVYVNADLDVVYDIILKAPAGIIHLPPPLTDEQREQLKALHTLTFRWLVKNKKGATIAYSHKPYRYGEYWATENVDANIQSVAKELSVCSLVSWSDPEPFDIGKALGVGE